MRRVEWGGFIPFHPGATRSPECRLKPVKAFLDTSVLVATFYADHEHHSPTIDLFLRFGKKDACCGAHSLAEVCATLAGMPGKSRVGGDEALLFIGDIRERLTLVYLDKQEYFQVAQAAAAGGLDVGRSR